MVELNFIRSTETEGFSDGAKIRLSTVVDILDETAFSSSMSLEMASQLFEGSAIHDALGKVHGILTSSMETYDPNALMEVFNSIVGYDQQLYYDIICIIRALIEVADNDEKNNFIRAICHIANAEVAGRTTYESADEATPEVESPKADNEDSKDSEVESVDATENSEESK